MSGMALCYICAADGANSRDHVIPKCLFTPPLPANLLTLPAHYSCHKRLAEEYVRAILSGLSAPVSRTGMNLWDASTGDGRAARSLAGNPGLAAQLRGGMVPSIDVYTPAGIYLGTAPAVRFDRERVYPGLEKIVRGLYRHHTGRLLPANTIFRWAIN